MEKFTRVRFSIKDDLCLLEEVIRHNPFDNLTRWKIIQANLIKNTNKNYTLRCIREHVDYLLKLFLKNDRSHLRQCGTEQQHVEKSRMLQQILNLSRKFRQHVNAKKESTISKDNSNDEAITTLCELVTVANCKLNDEVEEPKSEECEVETTYDPLNLLYEKEADHNYTRQNNSSLLETFQTELPLLQTLSSSNFNTSLIHPRNKKTFTSVQKKSALKMIRMKRDMERQLKEKQLKLEEKKLDLEERKIKLEEAKFALEKQERESRLLLEIKERENNILVAEQQQKIIKFLLENFSKK